VSADRGLGELQDRTQLIDTELIPLEGEQEPAPRRVGEGGHLPEKGWGGQVLNPFIRIKGYSNLGWKSRSDRIDPVGVLPTSLLTGIFLE
jgi:hypothetical protein